MLQPFAVHLARPHGKAPGLRDGDSNISALLVVRLPSALLDAILMWRGCSPVQIQPWHRLGKTAVCRSSAPWQMG